MTQGRPAFRQIQSLPEVPDEDLARFAESRGVPELVNPASPTPSGTPHFAQDAAKPAPRPSSMPKAVGASEAKNKPLAPDMPGPVERLHVELPGYLTDAMRLEAARNRTSMRHIVLRGLAAIGFHVESADLAPDGRRRPAKSTTV